MSPEEVEKFYVRVSRWRTEPKKHYLWPRKKILIMKTSYTYIPQGVCSRRIDITVEDGVVRNVSFTGGCNGNLQGISRLVEGMPVERVIALLKGIDCGGKGTSCPDQLSCALERIAREK